MIKVEIIMAEKSGRLSLKDMLIRGEGISQPQRIGSEIMNPRVRHTFMENFYVKRYAKPNWNRPID